MLVQAVIVVFWVYGTLWIESAGTPEVIINNRNFRIDTILIVFWVYGTLISIERNTRGKH